MNGAEHYREAEGLLDSAASAADTDYAAYYITRAQVHATLALTGATFDAAPHGPLNGEAWAEALA